MDLFDAGERTSVLLVAASGNFALLGIRLLIGAIVPLVLLEFDATKSSIGFALTGMWATYALLQFPSGTLSDKYGERPILLLAQGGTISCTLLVAVSPSLSLFGVSILLFGVASGLFYSPASTLVSRLYDERGQPLGIVTASGAVAGVMYPAIGAGLAVTFGWRAAIAFSAIVALPVLVATVHLTPSIPSANPDRSLRAIIDVDRHRDLLTRPGVILTMVIAVLVGFTFQAFTSFFPTFLVEHRGLETELAGVVFGTVFGLAAIAQPIAGRLSDRYSRVAAIGTSVTLAAIGLSVLLAAPSRVGLLVGTLFLGAGISWPGPIQAQIMDLFNGDERGYGFGLIRSMSMLIAASGSVVVGTLADAGGWILGYGVLIIVLIGCLLVIAVSNVDSPGL